MSFKWNHGLPFLPGYTFRDVTKSDFSLPQTLSYKNGFAFPLRPTVGIGKDPLLSEQLIQQQMNELSFETSDSAYSASDQSLQQDFIPAHVALDKKVLRFYGYFEEDILFSPEEDYRLRPVLIYYYLEDDSMSIFEPKVENSGLPHGKRIKRQRLPKNDLGEHYEWKDLNLAMDLEVYGFKYRITQCDDFTKEFMESEGIILNAPESMPEDPYIRRRQIPPPSFTAPSQFDSLHQFLTMDRKVLRFYALWENADPVYGESHPVTILYFLVDNTVMINLSTGGPLESFPVLLRRQKLPKKMKQECEAFPSSVLEVSAEDVDEYYSPEDFQLGQTAKLLGRSFLLYDCDGFTKEYYRVNHPDMEMKPVELPKKEVVVKERKKVIAPYNGFGSLEDSLQTCLSLTPKKIFIKMSEDDDKVLRFCARLDSENPIDEDRRFVLSYYPASGMISIYEKPTNNSGIMGGKFLKKVRIPKPGSSPEYPEFYSVADLALGATLEVFNRRFVLTDTDQYVLKYMESISNKIPSQTLDSLRQNLGVQPAAHQPADQIVDDVAERSS